MKIIHCADLHLDSAMTSNLTGEKARERKNELLEAFRRMVTYAAENEVDAIIIAGDLFDTKHVSATARNVVRDEIVSRPYMDFYYLQGNHDAKSFLEQLEDMPENLKLFSDEWTCYETGENGKVVIYGIEFSVNNSAELYNKLVPEADKINIVVLHGQESDSKAKNKAEVIPFSELRNKNIDYLALGHIHGYKKEKLDGRGIYCYPGCLEGRGFDEPGEHGFILLDIDETTGNINSEFVVNDYRRLYVEEVNISDCLTTNEISTRVEQHLHEKNYDSKHMLKLVLTGEIDISCEKDIDLLIKRFSDGFYFFKICDDTEYKVNPEDYRLDESLKGEFVRAVLDAADITDEDKAAIISCGVRALAGEEIRI